jgi:hypothetical protein
MMKNEAERRKQRRREHQECPVHAYQQHGKEAHELRNGIEKLIAEFSADPCDPVTSEDLQALLDHVDARDSLAYLERATLTKGATRG